MDLFYNVINQPWLGMVTIPPIYGDDWWMVYYCYTHITLFFGYTRVVYGFFFCVSRLFECMYIDMFWYLLYVVILKNMTTLHESYLWYIGWMESYRIFGFHEICGRNNQLIHYIPQHKYILLFSRRIIISQIGMISQTRYDGLIWIIYIGI